MTYRNERGEFRRPGEIVAIDRLQAKRASAAARSASYLALRRRALAEPHASKP